MLLGSLSAIVDRHLSDLSAAARVRWAESEGVSWSWYSDKQAYFHICQPCHMGYFPNDVRPKVGNRNTRPAASLSHNVVGGNVSRLMCGEHLACSSEAGFDFLRSGQGGRVVVENGVNTQAAPGSLK